MPEDLPHGIKSAIPSAPLSEAVARHVKFARASFHTPGHKGRTFCQPADMLTNQLWQSDLTELPGLDELSRPEGVIKEIELHAASTWKASESIISIGGASQGLISVILSLVGRGTKLLIPRNAHRSVIHALMLSGHEPVWYEPIWDAQWGLWGAVSPTGIEQALCSHQNEDIAAVLIVSPTYAGALSDITAAAALCHERGIPLIVDEAHGAHLAPATGLPPSAVNQGADAVVQSLHKTLSGLTQTGLVHLNAQATALDAEKVRFAMNILQTSSPSYPLLMSIEQAISLVNSPEGKGRIAALTALNMHLIEGLDSLRAFELYHSRSGVDPAHILMRPRHGDAEALFAFLVERGVFPEALLGEGVLFMLGIGSEFDDIDNLMETLAQFVQSSQQTDVSHEAPQPARMPDIEQVMTPREAFSLPSEVVPLPEAVGRIAAECVAPCPPGIPVLIPGQRVHKEVMNLPNLRSVKVLQTQIETK